MALGDLAGFVALYMGFVALYVEFVALYMGFVALYILNFLIEGEVGVSNSCPKVEEMVKCVESNPPPPPHTPSPHSLLPLNPPLMN